MTRIIQTGAAEQRQGAKLTTFIPFRIKRHGGCKALIPASGGQRAEHDAPILTALAKAISLAAADRRGHRCPEPRQCWRDRQKKAQPRRVGLCKIGSDGWT